MAHEPPVLRVLPDGRKWRRFVAGVYWLRFGFGANVAMFRFALKLGIPVRAYAKVPKELRSRAAANHDFFLEHEILPVSNYDPDIETIRRNGVKVFAAVGETTLGKGKFYGRTAPILAKMLGRETSVLPGHHISYLDAPAEWAAALRRVLCEASNEHSVKVDSCAAE